MYHALQCVSPQSAHVCSRFYASCLHALYVQYATDGDAAMISSNVFVYVCLHLKHAICEVCVMNTCLEHACVTGIV